MLWKVAKLYKMTAYLSTLFSPVSRTYYGRPVGRPDESGRWGGRWNARPTAHRHKRYAKQRYARRWRAWASAPLQVIWNRNRARKRQDSQPDFLGRALW